MSTVQKTVDVEVPVRTAYDRWTQFEQFPQFMEGVEEVTQLDDKRLHWKAKVAGVVREWDAEIVDQKPDQQIAWRSTGGTRNDGVVFFEADPTSQNRSHVRLRLEVEPEGLVERAGDALKVIDLRVEGDLKRFKQLVEQQGATTGWRGEVKPTGEVNRSHSGTSGLGGTTGGGAAGQTHT